ncbi:MAG: hydantoinase B/oxoprolinase family protein [Mangrovicoccus sp.]
MGQWEFWIDRGGTFTDIVAVSPDGELRCSKLLSENPEQYTDAAIEGIRRHLDLPKGAAWPENTIGAVKMGTTVATNALLERRGEPVLLAITKGFGDLLRIGTQARPKLFDLDIQRPALFYQSVVEIAGRMDATGAEISALEEDALRADLNAHYQNGFRAIAVALMHGHLAPQHEQRVGEIAREIGFEQISLSHEVSRLAKLVRRGDTTVVDAYLSPVLRRYVRQVSDVLEVGDGGARRLLFMQSSGGLTEATRFEGRDAILSGPAGGIVGMARCGEAAGFDRLIGFDMGGTSTDVSHYAGRYERSVDGEVAGLPLCVPMMDIHTVAAGGGSILSYRDGRAIVGPESAGANPGPACYRRGGPLTVTDCNVMLGRLHPDHFPAVFGPDGNEPLDTDIVRQKFTEMAAQISVPGQELSPEAAAAGFLEIAVDNMAAAIKRISVARGHDVSGYTLMSFGGAGGQHACQVADALGMRRVLLHPFAGVLSAFGMGLAELRAMRQQQFSAPLADLDQARAVLAEMGASAQQELAEQGAAVSQLKPRCYLRYEGAHQSLAVDIGDAEALRQGFEAAHLARFGFVTPERGIEFDLLETEAVAEGAAMPDLTPDQGAGQASAQIRAYWQGDWQETPLYKRADLAGQAISGPAIITEDTGTIALEPGWQAAQDAHGNLILTRIEAQAAPQLSPDGPPDPVRLEVMGNLFMSVADRMGLTLANTAWSVNIKERLDFSCAIFDAQGDLVANAPHVPVHLGSMSDSIKTVMRLFAEELRDGDAYLLNSPFEGGTHLPDVTVVTPVFVAGKPAFWLGSRGHHADIGGRTPGSAPPDSRHIDEEGVLIDPMPLVKNGLFLEDKLRAVLSGARYPARAIDQNIADLKAQIAANETGRAELSEIAQRLGLDAVSAYMRHIQDNAEASVKAALSELRDGSFTYPMDDGRQIQVAVRIDHAAQEAEIDFTGTSAQHPGNYNAPFAICRAVVLYVFRCLVGRDMPLNEGCLRPLHIIAPEGTMLRPEPPAAVIAGNTEVSQAMCNALIGALGVQAGSQGTMNNFIWGNETFQNYETIAGGTGAGPGFYGCDAVQSHMTNTRMTDPEILEARFPVRLEEFSIRKGSGGAGQWRGGDGVVRRLRFLAPVTVTTLGSHRNIPPFGKDQAEPGACGEDWLEMPDGSRRKLAGNDEAHLPAGAVFEMRTPGGGGWGPS